MKNQTNKNRICKATKHAYKRAKERLGWKPSVLDKMMNKAYAEGIHCREEAKGLFKKHLDKLWKKYGNCKNVRVHGEVIFFFSKSTLITLYRLDNKWIKHLSYLR